MKSQHSHAKSHQLVLNNILTPNPVLNNLKNESGRKDLQLNSSKTSALDWIKRLNKNNNDLVNVGDENSSPHENGRSLSSMCDKNIENQSAQLRVDDGSDDGIKNETFHLDGEKNNQSHQQITSKLNKTEKKVKFDKRRKVFPGHPDGGKFPSCKNSRSKSFKTRPKNNSLEPEVSPVFVYNGIEYCTRGCNTYQPYSILDEFELNFDGDEDSESCFNSEYDWEQNYQDMFNFSSKKKDKTGKPADNRTGDGHREGNRGTEGNEDDLLQKIVGQPLDMGGSNMISRLKSIAFFFLVWFILKSVSPAETKESDKSN